MTIFSNSVSIRYILLCWLALLLVRRTFINAPLTILLMVIFLSVSVFKCNFSEMKYLTYRVYANASILRLLIVFHAFSKHKWNLYFTFLSTRKQRIFTERPFNTAKSLFHLFFWPYFNQEWFYSLFCQSDILSGTHCREWVEAYHLYASFSRCIQV